MVVPRCLEKAKYFSIFLRKPHVSDEMLSPSFERDFCVELGVDPELLLEDIWNVKCKGKFKNGKNEGGSHKAVVIIGEGESVLN